jgi:predicted Zn-dependent protease
MNQLGETYQKLGRTDEALEFFRQGVALRPDNAQLHLNLARAYLAAGQRDAARTELQATIDRAPVASDVGTAAREELRRMDAGG